MTARVRALQLETGDDRDVLLDRFERREDRREFAQPVLAGGRPSALVATHGHEDVPDAADRIGGGPGQWRRGWNHRLQQRKCEAGPHAPQEGTTGQGFLAEDIHKAFLIVKGTLRTMPVTIADSR